MFLPAVRCASQCLISESLGIWGYISCNESCSFDMRASLIFSSASFLWAFTLNEPFAIEKKWSPWRAIILSVVEVRVSEGMETSPLYGRMLNLLRVSATLMLMESMLLTFIILALNEPLKGFTLREVVSNNDASFLPERRICLPSR